MEFSAVLIALCAGFPMSTASSSCYREVYNINYSLPMFEQCTMKQRDGVWVQSIPKLIRQSSLNENCNARRKNNIPPGHRICRIPDCHERPCQAGWCEETMESYECHCPPRFSGKNCETMTSVSETSSEHVTSESATSPESATLEHVESSTSPDSMTSKSATSSNHMTSKSDTSTDPMTSDGTTVSPCSSQGTENHTQQTLGGREIIISCSQVKYSEASVYCKQLAYNSRDYTLILPPDNDNDTNTLRDLLQNSCGIANVSSTPLSWFMCWWRSSGEKWRCGDGNRNRNALAHYVENYTNWAPDEETTGDNGSDRIALGGDGKWHIVDTNDVLPTVVCTEDV